MISGQLGPRGDGYVPTERMNACEAAEMDGRLPCGETLERAVAATDAETCNYPAYYMINCAHPTHFENVLQAGGVWRSRIRGLRANASKRSHVDLDQASDLDAGDPEELGAAYRALRSLLPRLAVVGGCCGTDDRHVRSICEALGRHQLSGGHGAPAE